MPDYTLRKLGNRFLILRDSEQIAHLDREGLTQQSNRGGVFQRPEDWTGRWTVHMLGQDLETVTSPAEGLLMVARIDELSAMGALQ